MSDIDLSWFANVLHPADQVALLRNPHGPLPARLVDRLSYGRGPGVFMGVTGGESGPWMLSPVAAEYLEEIRLQLDSWWATLTPDQSQYITENRDGELDGDYRIVVQAASADPITGAPHAYQVITAADCATGRFLLPKIVRAYVDMKAGEHE